MHYGTMPSSYSQPADSSGMRKEKMYMYTKMVGHIYINDKINHLYHKEEEPLVKIHRAAFVRQFKECINFFFFTPVIARSSSEEVTYRNYDCLFLLALCFVRSGAFPAVGLPLFVEAANTHSLPTTHRDVLFHKAGQHACRTLLE